MLLQHVDLFGNLRLTEVCVKRMLSPWLYTDLIYCYSSLYKRQQKYVSTLHKFVENVRMFFKFISLSLTRKW